MFDKGFKLRPPLIISIRYRHVLPINLFKCPTTLSGSLRTWRPYWIKPGGSSPASRYISASTMYCRLGIKRTVWCRHADNPAAYHVDLMQVGRQVSEHWHHCFQSLSMQLLKSPTVSGRRISLPESRVRPGDSSMNRKGGYVAYSDTYLPRIMDGRPDLRPQNAKTYRQASYACVVAIVWWLPVAASSWYK